MSHVFQRYFDKHGHYPHVVIRSGACRITVEFAPGYVRIEQSHPYSAQIYITRSAWFELLRRVVPISRKWAKHQDFDVPAALRAQWQEEYALLQEKRALKKGRSTADVADKADRQRRRFLAARARARREA